MNPRTPLWLIVLTATAWLHARAAEPSLYERRMASEGTREQLFRDMDRLMDEVAKQYTPYNGQMWANYVARSQSGPPSDEQLNRYGDLLAKALGAREWRPKDFGDTRYYRFTLAERVTVHGPGGPSTVNQAAVACCDRRTGEFLDVARFDDLPEDVQSWLSLSSKTDLCGIFKQVVATLRNEAEQVIQEADHFVLTRINQEWWGVPLADEMEILVRGTRIAQKVLLHDPVGFLKEAGCQIGDYAATSAQIDAELQALATLPPPELADWSASSRAQDLGHKLDRLQVLARHQEEWATIMAKGTSAVGALSRVSKISVGLLRAREKFRTLEETLARIQSQRIGGDDLNLLRRVLGDAHKDVYYTELLKCGLDVGSSFVIDEALDPEAIRKFGTFFTLAVEKSKSARATARAFLAATSRGAGDYQGFKKNLVDFHECIAEHITGLSACRTGYEAWRRTAGGGFKEWKVSRKGGRPEDFAEYIEGAVAARQAFLGKLRDFLVEAPWLNVIVLVDASRAKELLGRSH